MQFDVTPEKDGMMLSRLLLQVADVPQWAIKQAMKNRDVRVDGVRVSGDVRVREGQQIRVYWPKEVVASQGQSRPALPEKRPHGSAARRTAGRETGRFSAASKL